MNYDEFAFFNQQLAGMLRVGIPLEGALRQLSADMKEGQLRAEIDLLRQDLEQGTALPEALSRRKFPELYCRLLEMGVRGNDLPGVLTLVADHYHRTNSVWTRLKGLMVYPVLLIFVSLGLTVLLFKLCQNMLATVVGAFGLPPYIGLEVWAPLVALIILAVACAGVIFSPSIRTWLRWRLPPFREASLAQLASSLALMLKNGTPLPEALGVAASLEGKSAAGTGLRQWQALVENGRGKPEQWPAAVHPFPPLFMWLVRKGGEDLAGGFQRAAELYNQRAAYRIELALYAALPVSILLMGQIVLWQVTPVFRSLIWLMNGLGGPGE